MKRRDLLHGLAALVPASSVLGHYTALAAPLRKKVKVTDLKVMVVGKPGGNPWFASIPTPASLDTVRPTGGSGSFPSQPDLLVNITKSYGGLRPSFSSQVRFGEPGAPVQFLMLFVRRWTPGCCLYRFKAIAMFLDRCPLAGGSRVKKICRAGAAATGTQNL
jgi:hypothetical protein